MGKEIKNGERESIYMWIYILFLLILCYLCFFYKYINLYVYVYMILKLNCIRKLRGLIRINKNWVGRFRIYIVFNIYLYKDVFMLYNIM